MFEEDEDQRNRPSVSGVTKNSQQSIVTMDALVALESRIEEKLQSTVDRLDSTDERLSSFTEAYTATRELDMLAFADHSEKQDYASNQAKLMFVLITGESSCAIRN
jgi:hypothetical protein